MSKISLKHSGGKVVSLNSPTTEPNANDVAFKLPNADGSDGQALVTDGAGNLSFANAGSGTARNLIINGAMQVAQRGTSSTELYYQTVDRFRTSFGNLGSINLTQSQQQLTSSDTPYSKGFRYFYRSALSAAGTVNANGYIGISQRIEAGDMAQSGWNYTSASSNITIQFWFRCSTNQTFYMALTSQDGTSQSYVFSFTASGDNTWTKITKTIPGAANVQFDTDTPANAADRGLTVSFTPWYGTDYTGSKAVNQWSAYSGSAEYPDYASTWLTAGASTFDVTGVQLEVGSVATDFEHRSFGQELELCKRYCQVLSAEGTYTRFSLGYVANSTSARWFNYLRPEMRATPSFAHSGSFDAHPSTSFSISEVSLESTASSPQIAIINTGGLSNMSAGHAISLQAGNDANAKIIFNAEL